MKKINNFVVIDSVYGQFIVNRHCYFQAESLIKTGYPHIQQELEAIVNIVKNLPENSVSIDVGANIGLVCVPIANTVKAKGGVVYAFEVQKMLYNALCGTVALNDLDNLHVSNYGVGDKKEKLKVPTPDYSQPLDYGGVSLVNQNEIESFDEVEICTIDSLDLNRLDFIKVDVEGMEISVLQGGVKTIEKYRPLCWIEYWKIDKNQIKDFFQKLNYNMFLMDELNVFCVPEEKLGREIVVNAQVF